MKDFVIWYEPIWGQMTRYCQDVKAINIEHAEIKFYGTKSAENCLRIINIEKC